MSPFCQNDTHGFRPRYVLALTVLSHLRLACVVVFFHACAGAHVVLGQEGSSLPTTVHVLCCLSQHSVQLNIFTTVCFGFVS